MKLLGCRRPYNSLFRSNKASPELILASGEAISVVPGHQAMMFEVAHIGAKAKAPLSSEAISQAFFKAKALSNSAKIASFSEANTSHAFCEASLLQC